MNNLKDIMKAKSHN